MESRRKIRKRIKGRTNLKELWDNNKKGKVLSNNEEGNFKLVARGEELKPIIRGGCCKLITKD